MNTHLSESNSSCIHCPVYSYCRLIPGTTYHYKFGDNAYGWSDEYTFRAAPTPGPSVETRVLAIGGKFMYICVLLLLFKDES